MFPFPKPYHYDQRDLLLYVVGITVAIAAIASAVINKKNPDSETLNSEEPHSAPVLIYPAITMGTCLLFMVIQSFFHHYSTMQIAGDEYVRAEMAYQWALEPYFATSDHVWLAGQFYVLGSLYRIIGDLEKAVVLTSMTGMLILCAAATNLGARLWRNRAAAMATGLMVSVHWMVLWGSVAAIAEVFFFPLLLLAINAWLAAWQVDSQQPWKREGLLVLCALFIGLGNMFRYESWYIGIPLGAFFCFRFVYTLVKHDDKRLAILSAIAALLIAAYPVGHVLSSWANLGSPTAFFSTASDMNEETNLFYETESFIGKLLNYPKNLWLDHWYLLPVPLAGLGLAVFLQRRRDVYMMHVALATMYIMAILISLKAGLGSNTRPRYTMILYLPLAIYTGQVVLCLLSWKRLPTRIGSASLLLLFALSLIHGSLYKATIWYPNGWGLKAGDAAFYLRLRHEHDRQRWFDERPRIHPEGWQLHVFSHGVPEYQWPVRYHSHNNGNVQYLWGEYNLQELSKKTDAGVSIAVRKPMPENIDLSENYRRIFDLELWEIWHQRSSPDL